MQIRLIPRQLRRRGAFALTTIGIRFFSPAHETITSLSSTAGFVSGVLKPALPVKQRSRLRSLRCCFPWQSFETVNTNRPQITTQFSSSTQQIYHPVENRLKRQYKSRYRKTTQSLASASPSHILAQRYPNQRDIASKYSRFGAKRRGSHLKDIQPTFAQPTYGSSQRKNTKFKQYV